MWYNLYHYVHDTWNVCFWTPPALLVGVIMIAVVLIHHNNQKKRENDFEEARKEKLEALREEVAGQTAEVTAEA